MSLHTWSHHGPQKPSGCTTFMLNSHWGRAATGKKSLMSMCTGSLQSCPTLCDAVDCGLPGFSVMEGGSPGQEYWSVLTNAGCHALLEHYICPAALAANSPEYLVLPEPLRPKQLHHLHTWPLQGQTQVLQGSLRSKLQWMTHIQRWKENHNLNPRAVWLRKKTPNLPTSSTSCRLNPHDQLGRLCVCGIYTRALRDPTKENTPVLIAVDIGSKNTQE